MDFRPDVQLEKGDMEKECVYAEVRLAPTEKRRDAHVAGRTIPRWRTALLVIFLWLLVFHMYRENLSLIDVASLSRAVAEPTVIIGGGVIGLTTAYYLAEALGSGTSITIIDNAPELGLGASGQAPGLIGEEAWKGAARELGDLSYALHEQLAAEFDGETEWSFSEATVHELGYSDQESELEGASRQVLPPWLARDERYVEETKSTTRRLAHVRSLEFVQFLQRRCEFMGVKILLNTTAESVVVEHGELQQLQIQKEVSKRFLPCTNLVVAAGAWSGRVMSHLFPQSTYNLPMDSSMVDGWPILRLRVLQAHVQDPHTDVYSIRDILGRPLKMTATDEGEIMVDGIEDILGYQTLPGAAIDVEVNEFSITEMTNLALQVLNVTTETDVTVVEAKMAYIPELDHDGPLIAQIPLHLLSDNHKYQPSPRGPRSSEAEMIAKRTHDRTWNSWAWSSPLFGHWSSFGRGIYSPWQPTTAGGVFVNTGHAMHGIAYGPGSGMVMSEMILGRQPCVDLAGVSYLGEGY